MLSSSLINIASNTGYVQHSLPESIQTRVSMMSHPQDQIQIQIVGLFDSRWN